MSSVILKDTSFRLIGEFIRADAKKRLALVLPDIVGKAFNIYQNEHGQFMLDPVRAIPESECWVYSGPDVLASVKQGLRDSAEGKILDLGAFGAFAEE